MLTGVYTIVHIASGRQYIGSAKNVPKRWGSHRCYLRSGRHQNSYLQRAWSKYGEKAFQFFMLERTELDQLVSVEQEWLDRLWSTNRLFNRRRLAHSCIGIKHTPEAVANMRRACRGRVFSKEARDAALRVNIGKRHSLETKTKMSRARLGVRRSAKFHEKMSAVAKLRSREHLEAIAESLSQNWTLTEPGGRILQVRNLTRFAKKNGLAASKLYAVARGERPHHRGWKAARSDGEQAFR